MIKKLILIILAIIAINYSGKFYVVYRMTNLMSQCVDMKLFSELDKADVPKEEKITFAREGWSCVKTKQNILDKMIFWVFFTIPETWLVQPSK